MSTLLLAVLDTAQGCTVYDGQLIDEARGVTPSTGTSSGGETSFGSGGIPPGLGGVGTDGGSPGSAGGAPQSGGGPSTPTGGLGGAIDGTGGGNAVPDVKFDFAEDLQGFIVSFEDTSGPFSSTATWDETEGDPEAGSAFLEIGTAGAEESVFFSRILSMPLDLRNVELTARVRLDLGLSGNPVCPGGAYVLAKSGNSFVFARGTWRNLVSANGWSTLTMNLDSPVWADGEFDASDVRELGVAIATGGAGCAAPDWQAAQVYVDSIDY